MRRAGWCGALAVALLAAMGVTGQAAAAWGGVAGGGGRTSATTMPAGQQPTATVTGPASSSVNVTWPASSGGAPVAGYLVRSYDATTGTPRTVGAGCVGLIIGTACTEAGVPNGSWRYSVTPRQQAWAGAESPLSAAVSVDASYRALVLSHGPAAYWRLGERSGSVAVDQTAANHGTYGGGVGLGAAGALHADPNTAVDLDGTSGRMSAPSTPSLNLSAHVSIEAWVNPDTLTGTRWIVNKGTFYYLYISEGTTYFGINAGGPYLFVTTTAVTPGTWQHLVGTYDGSNLVLYRNGAVVAQAPATGAISTTTAAVFVGAVSDTGAFLDGRLDEVAVYGTALTPAQVLGHFQRGNGTRPTVNITFPTAGATYANTGWNSACGSRICGTATDTGGGVASVAVSVRQGSGNYWNGSSFSSATEVLLAATGTTSWFRPFPAGNFPANGMYTVRAVATDAAGNAASSTRTFTIDRTAPTVAIGFPANNGTYNDAGWNAGCASQVCGTAADVGSAVASVTVSVRQNAGGNYWNGVAFASNTEVLLPAAGTAAWGVAFPATNFPANGVYTVRAVATDLAGNTSNVSGSFTFDRTNPAPSGLTLTNANGLVTGGTDEVRIVFTEALAASSICSAWSGTGPQSLSGSGVVVTITDNGLNDLLTVAAAACTLHIGTVATGGDYVTATATFSGSTAGTESRINWAPGPRQLTIRIGALTTGALNATPQLAGMVTYTPDPTLVDLAGNAIVPAPLVAPGQRF